MTKIIYKYYSAFRLLPIHKSDFVLLGFKIQNMFFIDKGLAFGCSVSCTKSIHKLVCHVSFIRLYLQFRTKCRGSLFNRLSENPVTRYQVVLVFNMLIEKLG